MDSNYFAENAELNKSTVKSHKSVSIPTLIISILTTIVLVLIVMNNWNNIVEMIGLEQEIVETEWVDKLTVWDEVKLSWYIFDDGDLINYTHILDSLEYGEIWLKSQNINLNNYEQEVYIEGIVEKIQQWVAVVEIDTIYSLNLEEKEENIDTDQEDSEELSWDIIESRYLSNMWLYLDDEFFEKYSLVNEWEGGVLKIKDIETNYIINLDYFKCNDAINEQNCGRFNEIFANSASEKFVASDGTNYYKQSEVQSWFFSNGDLFWFFANDVEDKAFKSVSKYIKLVNTKFVENEILDRVGAVCWEPGKAVESVNKYELVLKNNDLYLNIEWDDWVEINYICETKVNPLVKNMLELVELTEDDLKNKKEDCVKTEDDECIDPEEADDAEKAEDEDKENQEDDGDSELDLDDDVSEIISEYDWDLEVEQFPINLEKSLEFSSRRGHTIVFPSSNIAYAGTSVQKDFDQKWVNCFSVMNVVKYSEKADVEIKWNVKIYECTIKDWFDDWAKNLIYKAVWEKDFVVEIVNPAWIDFADNLIIK